jgi:hypothetical protein
VSPAIESNEPLSISALVYACGCGGGGTLAELRARVAPGGVEVRLIEAALAQCDGDVRRADRLLKKAWENARPGQRPWTAAGRRSRPCGR